MKPRAPAGLSGVSGTLVSGSFAADQMPLLFAGQLGEATRQRARNAVSAWYRRMGTPLGPASSPRTLARSGARPLMAALGFDLGELGDPRAGRVVTTVASANRTMIPLVVTPWGEPMDRYWPDVTRAAMRIGGEWALCFNGRALRLCDVHRVWARNWTEFDLEIIASAPASFALLWGLLRPDALAGLSRRIVNESDRHGVAVRASLREGVREALQLLLEAILNASQHRVRRGVDCDARDSTFEQALTIIYRILFLLFAESRGLVPVWHPVYRSSYTIEALRAQADRPGDARGLWEALQALSRLAHSGCKTGTLKVTPFNGRLFAPGRTPLAEGLRLDDTLVARALVALTTHKSARGREPISFRDLGVEQLGAVYESVLEYEAAVVPASRARDRSGCTMARGTRVTLVEHHGRRKASGTFYTPQSMTDNVVRHTLHPLVAGRTAAEILALRVLDPAMGSGAFLVSACRYLAGAYEEAIVRERGRLAADMTDADRAGYRRLVARRCLYGVDLNPMAVQVARLSLWLATLAADRPLTFLDHHLAAGDSLVGASLDDLARQPPGTRHRSGHSAPLPLFEATAAGLAFESALPLRHRLETVPDDSAAAVHDKERMVAELGSPSAPLARLKRAADLWCACWFWNADAEGAPDAREYSDLASAVLYGRSNLPARLVQPRLSAATRIALSKRFFHWTLEFPEVFIGPDGTRDPDAGFDAVIGNPPWEMLRGDYGPSEQRGEQRVQAAQLTRFVRGSGIYSACMHGHANQYQLFVERSLRLVKRGGRVGLILPWGLASDHGCSELRRVLLDECNTDRLVGFENASGIFPIHRGVRFLLLSTATGSPTIRMRCRFGAREPGDLETSAARLNKRSRLAASFVITRQNLRRVSGPALAVPWVSSRRDLRLAERLVTQFAPLSSAAGWRVTFGRELNATDDRAAFTSTPGAIPVIDGKHIDPFVVRVTDCDRWIADPAWLESKAAGRAAAHSRLAYRDVAASTNRLTLIAAILPARTAAVHTLMCLKTLLPVREQQFLCGLLNSLVANYLVRMWVTTHLGTTTVERLPVPRPAVDSAPFERVVTLVRRLEQRDRAYESNYVELQALAARLYALSDDELETVLETFPLIDPGTRSAIAGAFSALEAQPQ